MTARATLVALAAPLIFVLLVAASLARPAAAASAVHGTFARLSAEQSSSISNDWAGYATSGTTYTSVAGSWAQPNVNCSSGPDSYAAFWVGLDGYMTRTVEQIGTDSDCSQGSPAYYAWYEMFPAYPVTLSRPVAAGDAISASVASNGSGDFTLKISDATQHWTFTTNKASSAAQLGSAEWIAEAPSNGRHTLPLSDFGSVTFTNCTANGSGIVRNPNVDEIVLGSPYRGIEAQPSTLSGSGESFSVATGSSAANDDTGPASPSPTQPTPTPPSQPYPWPHHHHWHGSGSGGWWSIFGL
ncbi:MAG TPA: G1 family glutamic endopeptidase [Ktedonobacterales bacterium]